MKCSGAPEYYLVLVVGPTDVTSTHTCGDYLSFRYQAPVVPHFIWAKMADARPRWYVGCIGCEKACFYVTTALCSTTSKTSQVPPTYVHQPVSVNRSWFIGRHAFGVEKLCQPKHREEHIKEKKEWQLLLWKLWLIADFGSGMHGLECPGQNLMSVHGLVKGKKIDYWCTNGERREEYQYMKCIKACKVFKLEWQQRNDAQKSVWDHLVRVFNIRMRWYG